MKAILIISILLISTPVSAQKINAFFFGDSVTAGNYPKWTKGLTQEYKFSVFAKNGARARYIYQIMKVVLTLDSIDKPDCIIVYAGINDCVSGKISDAEKAKSSISDIIELARSRSFHIFVFKLHTRNACSYEVNKWLDSVSGSYLLMKILSADIGPKIHPSHKDEVKMALVVQEAIMGYSW